MSSSPLYQNNFSLHLQERQGYDRPILLKELAYELPTSAQIRQLHNEYAITRQLADVPGVRKVYAKEGVESYPVLLLEYIQGQTLSELIQAASLDLSEKLQNAIEIAGILSRIHEQQVMHKDINPSNILVAEDGGVYIIDFGIASNKRREHLQRTSVNDGMLGSLAYISPEQTGRMNRPVDYRTDLYSLGITLYELFTNQLPFETDDVLGMIHCHLAQTPTPLSEIDADIPLPLSDIILRLLAKDAEDRYQSARGLQADLQICLDQLQATSRIESFELGQDDFAGRLQISHKLYGRQDEMAQVLNTFGRSAQGAAELLLISGYAGVGKTSLIHELHKTVIARQGTFIEGKFDQYQQNVPYFAWMQAFAELVSAWISEGETSLAKRRKTILKSVGSNGQVLVDVIPSLVNVIGPQPTAPQLGGVEAQNRFNYLFKRFVKAITSPDNPLIIFLDDIQWTDLASLNLLETLLSDPKSTHLLVIGAYRDNEVDATHPLMLGLDSLKEAGCTVNQLTPRNLTLEHVNELLSDSMHMPSDHCLPLAELIHKKTDGNALFAHQLLLSLEADGLLTFEQNSHAWRWDLDELNQLTISPNVIDLMVSKIIKLPAALLETLKLAACLGNQFELATFNLVSGQTLESSQQALQPAYDEGFLIQLNGSCKFVHDRIQQAVYILIAEQERVSLHRRIGQTWLNKTTPQILDESLFEIVGHLNLGASLIETEAERFELAELNFKATQKARNSIAYGAASAYGKTGIDLLAANGWQAHYLLMLNLHQLAAEAAYLNLDHELSEQHIAAILAQAQSLIDQVPAHITQIRIYFAQNLNDVGIETGLAVLDELGFALVESEPAGVSVQAISELAPMIDPQASAAAEILNSLLLPAHVSAPKLLPSLLYTALHLNLKFGLHPSSCMMAMVYAAFVWSEDIDQAYQFGELAVKLVEKLRAYRYMCEVRAGVNAFVFPWKSHYRTVEKALKDTVQIGLEMGDKSYAMSSLVNGSYLNIFLRDQLDQAQENMTQDIRLMQQSGENFNLFSLHVWTQFVVNLRGRAQDPLCFQGPLFDEAIDLPLAQAAKLYQTIYFLHLLKLILHYHLGHFQAALAYSEKAESFLQEFRSFYLIPLLPFYQSLAILQLSDGQNLSSNLVKKLEQNLQKLQLWAQHAPMNHQHKVDLILAEKARFAGDVGGAIDHYEAAITGARENEYLHEEALATELYGRFWDQRGNDSVAQIYLREAHALYDHWGAAAIVEHLETQYPQQLKIKLAGKGPLPPSIAIRESPFYLDLQTVLKASQTIAGELELDKLLNRLMTIVIENAGAQRGFLILEQDSQWVIEAVAEAGGPEPQVMQAINLTENNLLSAAIVQYVARTQQTVVLADAALAGEFVQDPYIEHHQVKSLLCIPLVNLGKTSGILYLENNLAAGVFSPERLQLLDLLSSQMAISIDQARLHRNLEQRVEERTAELQEANEQLQREIMGRMEAEEGQDESRSRLASILDAAMDAIITINEEQIVVMSNPAATQMFGYAEADIVGRPLSLLIPEGNRKAHADLVRASSQSHVTNRRMAALGSLWGRRANGEEFPIEVAISQVKISGQKYYTAIARDITERRKAEATLRESEEKFRNIAEQSPNMIFISQNGRIVFINQQATEIMGYSQEELFSPDISILSFVAADSIELVQSNFARLMRGEKIPTHEYTLLTKAKERVEAIIALRLINYDRDWAILGVVTDVSRLKRTEASLRRALDEQVLLLDSSRKMTTALQLDTLLNVILDYLGRLVKFTGAVVYIREEDDMVVRASQFAEGLDSLIGLRFALDALPLLDEMMTIREPIIVNDTSNSIELIQEIEFAVGRSLQEYMPVGTTLIGVPLIAKDQLIGIVVLSYNEPGYYSREKTDLLQAFINQAAIAIDNARLYQQVQWTAVLEERDRLASELHDAVTQTLFSASLIAKALPDIWEKDPAIGRTYMEQLPRLLQGALAEMRTLLLELRPIALRDQTLVQLLELLVDAASARSGATVTLKVEGDRPLPEDVTMALHRIAQESLNNVTKHAEASEVKVRLICDPEKVVVQIADDGHGFDPETIPPGHLGVGIMRERAQKIGATFQIDSKPGDGTLVVVTWSDQA
jgi:PAS domain S-box-containing protein